LLLPSLGPNARKTNYDYTKGKLDDLIDVIIEEKTKLFVCAVGVPPKEVVEKLHKAGILVMNVSPFSLFPSQSRIRGTEQMLTRHLDGRTPKTRPESPRPRGRHHLCTGRRRRWTYRFYGYFDPYSRMC
jgi:hypothetical protein